MTPLEAETVAAGGVWAGVWPWCPVSPCWRPPYNAVKSSAEEPLVLHFLPVLSAPDPPIGWIWCSSRSPETPRRFPTPTRFGRSSSIICFWLGQGLEKFSCLLKIAGKMLNCWGISSVPPGELTLAPRHVGTPLKSNLGLVVPPKKVLLLLQRFYWRFFVIRRLNNIRSWNTF